MAGLVLDEICKGWDFPVLDRLSLTVEEGEFFVIVGPSGIGKTTLLRCIAGLERLDAGRVIIGGQDVTAVKPYRRGVAMTFESYALYPHLTVFENIASPLRARRQPKEDIARQVESVAKLLKIDHLLDRRPHEVSGGQKQRTALGRTLVAKPEIFLLDEPISHLDAKIRHELRRQFHTLEDLRRVATLYVTHDYAEALSLGDRIGVMGEGGLVQIGSPREVFEKPADLFAARVLGQPSINEFSAEVEGSDGALSISVENGAIRFPISGPPASVLGDHSDRGISVGMRPQHLSVVRDGASSANGHPTVEGTVDVHEALGATGVLIATVGEQPLTVITSPEDHYASGEPVKIALEPENFLYFDRQSGRNLMLGQS
ncbi:MAG: ABC transporter ATP-binding protein [Pseudomonadota bacterium]